ncbi:MAG: hypothetical protein ACE5GX_19345 [Thermoanaerobaculia bacterium]
MSDKTAATEVRIRRGSIDDAEALSELGSRTFRETFESLNTPEDMALYLEQSFAPATLAGRRVLR